MKRGRPKKNREDTEKKEVENLKQSKILEVLEILDFLESFNSVNANEEMILSFQNFETFNNDFSLESFNYFFILLNKIFNYFHIDELTKDEIDILNRINWKIYISENVYKNIMLFHIIFKRLVKFLFSGVTKDDNQYLWKDGSRKDRPEQVNCEGNQSSD